MDLAYPPFWRNCKSQTLYNEVPQIEGHTDTAVWVWRAAMLRNSQVRFGGGRLETQVMLCAGRLSYMVAFCESKEDAEEMMQILKNWLKERGLELSPEKTKIRHLSDGFDFLGFNIRQYKSQHARAGWKLFIKPSRESVQRLRDKLRKTWYSLKGQNVSAIVGRLNPVIRGWANYYRIGVAFETFSKLDNWMFRREMCYVNHTHSEKPKYWKKAKYWGKLIPSKQDNWVFGDKQKGRYLLKFTWFTIERHVLVKGRASPDDPNLREYWQKRNATKAKDLMPNRKRMAREQVGICPVCGESLFNDEELQVHHKKPVKEGGKDTYSNLQLLHLYCHQQVHSMLARKLRISA